jgi:hypothetical protein
MLSQMQTDGSHQFPNSFPLPQIMFHLAQVFISLYQNPLWTSKLISASIPCDFTMFMLSTYQKQLVSLLSMPVISQTEWREAKL